MTVPAKDIFELFSQALFEGVTPMMVQRDHLVRHPDRCTQNAVCIPVCPTGAWLSTPPFKFDSSRCLETCRSVLGRLPLPGDLCCLPQRVQRFSNRRRTDRNRNRDAGTVTDLSPSQPRRLLQPLSRPTFPYDAVF